MFVPYLDKFVAMFIDDILEYSKNEEEHTEHLKIVLESLRKEKLHGKNSKCKFWLKTVPFLRHIIFEEGISVHQSSERLAYPEECVQT